MFHQHDCDCLVAFVPNGLTCWCGVRCGDRVPSDIGNVPVSFVYVPAERFAQDRNHTLQRVLIVSPGNWFHRLGINTSQWVGSPRRQPGIFLNKVWRSSLIHWVQEPLNVRWVAELGSHDFDPLPLNGYPRTPPDSGRWVLFLGQSLQDVENGRSDACHIPHLRFHHVDPVCPCHRESCTVAYAGPTRSGRCLPSRYETCWWEQGPVMFSHGPGDCEVSQLNTSSQRSGDGELRGAYDPVVRHAVTTG